MITADKPKLSYRDRAVLRAIAAGRCTTPISDGICLSIDGLPYCDQFAGSRLVRAGLITVRGGPKLGSVRLTASGEALLRAA
jgi:hypothetical protein